MKFDYIPKGYGSYANEYQPLKFDYIEQDSIFSVKITVTLF